MKILFLNSKNIWFTLVSFLLVGNTLAQSTIYRAKNGSKISVETLESNPDLGRNTALYLGPIGIGGLKLLGFDHYQPTKFFASAMIGPSNYMIEGNYFLANFTKNIKKSRTVKANSSVRYTVKKFPSVKRSSLGLHLNINHLNQLNFSEVSANYGSYRTTEICPGISWFTAQNLKLNVDGKVLQGNAYKRINLDAVFHSFRSINISEYTNVYYIGTNTGKDTISSTKSIDDVLHKVGYKFYLDGKATAFGRGRMTYKYLIGVQSSPLKLDGLRPRLIGGFEIGYSFNMKKKINNSNQTGE